MQILSHKTSYKWHLFNPKIISMLQQHLDQQDENNKTLKVKKKKKFTSLTSYEHNIIKSHERHRHK